MFSGETYNNLVDWYSLGCLIYELLTGKSPYNRRFSGSDYNKKPTYPPVHYPDYLSKDALDII